MWGRWCGEEEPLLKGGCHIRGLRARPAKKPHERLASAFCVVLGFGVCEGRVTEGPSRPCLLQLLFERTGTSTVLFKAGSCVQGPGPEASPGRGPSGRGSHRSVSLGPKVRSKVTCYPKIKRTWNPSSKLQQASSHASSASAFDPSC